MTPFAVGMAILILHTVGVPLTGASMNPARSFGPAVVRGGACWNNHWVYWLGPLIGSTIAAFVAQTIFLSNPTRIGEVFANNRGEPPRTTITHDDDPYINGEPGHTELEPGQTSS